MNEDPPLPPPPSLPPELPPPDEPDPVGPARWRPNSLALLYLAGFVVLAAAIIWLWQNPPPEGRPSVDPAEVAALRQQVQSLDQRIAGVEQRPLPQPLPDLKPLEARIAALEQRPAPDLAPLEARIAALEQRPAPDLAPLETRIAALEQRPSPDLAPLEHRIVALEQRPQVPGDVATKVDLAGLASRVDAIAGREDQLANRQQGLETTLGNRLDAMDGKLGALQKDAAGLSGLAGQVQATDKRVAVVEQQAGQVSALADKAGRIGRVQAAQAALDAGEPLGDVPDAPPSLTRFAQARPPTEAALRLAFPAAARAAEDASRPSTEGEPFLDRMWTRAQDLVTVREGDRVIVGDPAAGVIARARHALMAGDLAGAVAALDGLSGPAAAAMADWKARAKSLLDARAALASMAAHA